ncbi:hypothetical protein LCGC14_2242400 [marine sediment metagenome]|uniref:Uncharacterized protein n=1 Tax=marine sediment metagenome TaxID=412755 RepID=A0A0F9D564_9ZZZZ
MKSNKYGTPKERIVKFALCLLFIVIVGLLSGAGKKFYLSDYEEECFEYKQVVQTYNWTSWNYEPDGCEWLYCITCPCDLMTEVHQFNITTADEECLKYHLVRIGGKFNG